MFKKTKEAVKDGAEKVQEVIATNANRVGTGTLMVGLAIALISVVLLIHSIVLISIA